MNWFVELFVNEGVAQTVLLFSIVIALGILLGKIKVFGVSLGITWVLFVGILFGELGFHANQDVLHFVKEFGLILFVFSVGMQVGPSFFTSFKKGGLKFNMLASCIVFLGVALTIIIHFITGIPMGTMVGILSGAITNTPGLGAAQQAYLDLHAASGDETLIGIGKTIPQAYACAYPLGVVGIILSLIFIRYFFKINFDKEMTVVESEKAHIPPKMVSIEVENPAMFGKSIIEISKLIQKKFVISRVYHSNDVIEIASSETLLQKGDKIYIITTEQDANAVISFIGKEISMQENEWIKLDEKLISRRIMVTVSDINGKNLGQLKLRSLYGVNITRVNRAGIDLVASPRLSLQIGDRVTVVGTETAVNRVEKVLGNQLKRLREPNLMPIFIGIALGVILGSIPFMIPGIPQPIKLGLAGGPLLVSILVSRFGYKYKLITYSSVSANLILRELGITLFLASVGIGAGNGFLDTVIYGGGLQWIGIGFAITTIPIITVGCLARYFGKINYFSLMGLVAGSTTDPPALAYANATAGNDCPAVTYATVYPLTMFLRVLTAQLLILIFC